VVTRPHALATGWCSRWPLPAGSSTRWTSSSSTWPASPPSSSSCNTTPQDPNVTEQSGYATSIFIIGWAIGGLIFGILGDRIGRTKTMMLTIVLYSAFTGLSAFAVGVYDFRLLPLPDRPGRSAVSSPSGLPMVAR